MKNTEKGLVSGVIKWFDPDKGLGEIILAASDAVSGHMRARFRMCDHRNFTEKKDSVWFARVPSAKPRIPRPTEEIVIWWKLVGNGCFAHRWGFKDQLDEVSKKIASRKNKGSPAKETVASRLSRKSAGSKPGRTIRVLHHGAYVARPV